MADIVDVTSEREEMQAPMLLAASRRPEGPQATGQCLWCEAKFPEGSTRKFCDQDCRNDFEHAAKRRAVNGKQD